MTITQRLECRARDAVERCMIRHLILPTIFFDAPWPDDGASVDMLLIDRAGTGDVHVVAIKRRAEQVRAAIPQLLKVPAQYRWIVFFADTVKPKIPAPRMNSSLLYPAKGMGRVGVIEVVRMSGLELGANIKVKSERFPGSFEEEVEQFLAGHKPDRAFR